MSNKQVLTGIIVVVLSIYSAFAEERHKPHEKKAFKIYETLISLRTAKGHGKVPAMVDFLVGEFRSAGFADKDIHILPHEETASLVVRYRGDGSSGKKPILLLGHMDVVDALAEDWEREPFTLTEDNGFFFGRGTDDNKYGITNLTQTFIRLKKEGFVPNRDLVIAFSGDEEVGMQTTRMLAYQRKDLTDAEFALNSDAGGGTLGDDGLPLVYRVQAAEKTYVTFELTIQNPGGHSSRPRNDNAIYELAEAISKIATYRFPIEANQLTRDYLASVGANMENEIGRMLRAFAANPENKKAADYLANEPEYIGTTRTTCVATMLRAGHAENALPQSATVTVNCRVFPGGSVKAVQATLAKVVGNDKIQFTVLGDPTESPASIPTDEVMSALAKSIHSRYPGLPIVPYLESGGTDGMHFRKSGVPTFAISAIFMHPKDMFAHGLNERVPVSAFYDGLDHWMIILKELAGPDK